MSGQTGDAGLVSTSSSPDPARTLAAQVGHTPQNRRETGRQRLAGFVGLLILAAAGVLLGIRVIRTELLLAALAAFVGGFILIYNIPARHFLTAFLVYLPFSLRIELRGDTSIPSAFALLYFALARFFVFEFGKRSRPVTWSWTHVWTFALLALGTFSTLTSIDTGESVRKMFYVLHFALTYLAVVLIWQPEDVMKMLPALSIGMSLLALIGIGQFATSLVVGRTTVAAFMQRIMVWTVGAKATATFVSKGNAYNWYTKFGAMRAVGLGVTAMQFAQNLLFALMPAAAITFSQIKLPRGRRVYLLTFIMCLGGIIASFSRGGWVAAVTGLVLLFVIFFVVHSLMGQIKTLRFIAVCVALLLLVVIVLPTALRQNLQDMLLSIVNVEGESTANYVGSNEVRFLTYQIAWEVIKEYPYLGVGPGNYATAADNVQNVTATGTAANAQRNTPHSQLLLVAAEMGIPALLVYLLLALAACGNLVRVVFRGRDPALRLASAGWFATLIGLGVYYLFETNAYIPDVNCLLWAVAGLSVVARASLAGAHVSQATGTPGSAPAPSVGL